MTPIIDAISKCEIWSNKVRSKFTIPKMAIYDWLVYLESRRLKRWLEKYKQI